MGKVSNVLRNSKYMQYVCVLTAAMSVGCTSMAIAWTSVSLPKLTSNNSSLATKLTSTQSSWVASVQFLGMIPGSFVTGLLMNRFGRKGSLFIGGLISFVCWIGTALSKTAELLIAIRFISGLGGGIILTVVPVYIGEIADTDVRGRLGVMYTIFSIFGNVFVLCIGPFVSYTSLSYCCGAVTFLFLLSFFYLVESPHYLVQKHNLEGARLVLKRMLQSNIDESDLDNRLSEIDEFVKNDETAKASFSEIISTINYRKSFLIVCGLKLMQVLSGYASIRSYLQPIMQSSGSSISPEISSIVFGVVQLPAALVAAAVVDKVGRKPLLILSTIGCSLSLIAEGVYFYLESINVNTDSLSWLPTIGLCLYLIVLPLGVSTIPNVMSGELFAARVKNVLQTVNTCIFTTAMFGSTILFEPISIAWGMYSIFWIYAGVCICGCFFVVIYLPETKGKSFTEIQTKLSQ